MPHKRIKLFSIRSKYFKINEKLLGLVYFEFLHKCTTKTVSISASISFLTDIYRLYRKSNGQYLRQREGSSSLPSAQSASRSQTHLCGMHLPLSQRYCSELQVDSAKAKANVGNQFYITAGDNGFDRIFPWIYIYIERVRICGEWLSKLF